MGSTSIDGQLHHSQLTVNHKRASVSTQNRRLSPLQTSNLPKSESAPSSMAHPPAPENRHFQLARPSVIGRWQGNQGTSSPLTPSADDFPPPPTQRNSHASSMNVGDDSAAPKEGSRTSRFFKRMSNFGTGHKRRTSGQNVVSAMSALDVSSNQRSSTAAATDRSDTPPAVVVGDLNVQFPDSLVSTSQVDPRSFFRAFANSRHSFGNVVLSRSTTAAISSSPSRRPWMCSEPR